jgi:autotransporter-associated beta strand protein
MYNLSGTGILSATQYQYVGYSGTGSFTQSGGTSSVQGPLYLGYNAGASGTYTLSGGSPSIPYYNNNSLYVGYSGTGAFTQSGGTNASISLCLGYNAGSSGAYNLNGGTLVVPSISGGAGTAAFNFGGGTLLATGTFSVGVPMTLNAGVSTINASSGKTLALRPMTRNAGGTVDFNSNTTGTITTTQANTNGILGPWATYGSGTSMNYAAASGGSAPYTIVPYTGATTIASGVTGLTDTTGAVNYTLSSSGGTLTAAVSANTLQLTGTASTITASGANPLSLNGIMDVGSGTATIAGGNLIIGSNKELLFTGPGNVTVGATVRDNGSGASALTMAGGGTLLLGAANTYSGNTFISGGTLQLGNAAALPQGANAGNVFLSGTLDLNNLSANVNGLSGGGLVTSSAAGSPTLTVGSNNATSTFGGVIQNGSATSVALAKTGSGTLSLTGSNTYTGPTSINAGSLIADGSLASTAVMINGGATLGGTGSIGGSVTVAGGSSPSMWGTISLVDGAAGTLTLSDAMSTNTVLTIGGSTAGSSSFLDFEVGTSADRILIAAGKVLVNSGGGIINITPLAGFGPGTYDLMDFASNQASGLGYLSLATTSVDGYPLSLQSTPTAEQLVVAVPEPSTLALLAASAAGLLTYGWRRRR